MSSGMSIKILLHFVRLLVMLHFVMTSISQSSHYRDLNAQYSNLFSSTYCVNFFVGRPKPSYHIMDRATLTIFGPLGSLVPWAPPMYEEIRYCEKISADNSSGGRD